MVLTEKTLEDILEYLENSIANLAKEALNSSEFQTIKNLEHFLSSQYNIRLTNLLQGKNSDIHHLESGMKNKIIQRKQFLLDNLKKEFNFK